MRVGFRVAPFARRAFKRRNGVGGAALHHQSAAENVQSFAVPRIGLEKSLGNPLRFLRAIGIQCGFGLLHGVAARPRDGTCKLPWI